MKQIMIHIELVGASENWQNSIQFKLFLPGNYAVGEQDLFASEIDGIIERNVLKMANFGKKDTDYSSQRFL